MGMRVQMIQGTAIEVGQKKLAPLMRLISWGRGRAVVRRNDFGGLGAAFVRLQPVAILEESPQGQRRIPVHDATARQIVVLLGLAVAVPLFLNLLLHLIGCTPNEEVT